METIVKKILEEKFEYERGNLEFSVAEIRDHIVVGTTLEGSFTIYGPKGKLTIGQVISTDARMEILTKDFSGEQDEILYCFHGENIQPGMEIKGCFEIISNRGEYTIPFSMIAENETLQSSMGEIRDLFLFVNLAKTNWDEAVALFYHPNFRQLFTGGDKRYYAIYRGLSQVYMNQHNVDEFLVEINKKKPVEILCEQKELVWNSPSPLGTYQVELTQNGWGYFQLEISVDGDFLSMDEIIVDGEDFIGGKYVLPIKINFDALHSGRNYGFIRIKNDLDILTIPITIKQNREYRYLYQIEKQRKPLVLELMECFKNRKFKKITLRSWLQESSTIIDKLLSLDEQDLVAKLYRVQLLISQERENEARWELEQIYLILREIKDEKLDLWCYYLYLNALINKDEDYIQNVATEIYHHFEQNRKDFRLGLLYLYLEPDFDLFPQKKWHFLEDIFYHQCNSAVIYMEAVAMLIQNVTLLSKLDAFELSLIRYAAKNHLITGELMEQFIAIAQRETEFSKVLLEVMKCCYQSYHSVELLELICMQLMKGDYRDQRSFSWYAIGVEKELRITSLFEYYMQSYDIDNPPAMEIPRMVLMYFSFQSDLSWEKNAFLYRYVCEHQSDFPNTYDKYQRQIKEYVVKQASKGRINENLAYLYQRYFTKEQLTGVIAHNLSELIFAKKILDREKRFVKLEYIQEDFTHGIIKEFQEGHCYYPSYLDSGIVVLEDQKGNRYVNRVAVSQKQMMIPAKMAILIEPFVRDNYYFDSYICMAHKSDISITTENVERYRKLADSNEISNSLKNAIYGKVLAFYYQSDDIESLDYLLDKVAIEQIGLDNYHDCLKLLITRGKYEKAYDWVKENGVDGVDAQYLVRLCCGLLLEIEPEKLKEHQDAFLEWLMLETLRAGKRQETIVKYLLMHYKGTMHNLHLLFNASRDLNLSSRDLCELILIRSLYTGGYVSDKRDIFMYYLDHNPDYSVVCAVVTKSCYDYFVHQNMMETYVFEALPQLVENGIHIPIICGLAYVQNYAEKPFVLDEMSKKMLTHFLWEQVNHDIVLPCFKEFVLLVPQLARFMDKTVIQYRAKPGNKVTLHYLVENAESDNSEYCTEEMVQIYEGVYTKVFVLFFGETIQYYITESDSEEENITESGTLRKNDVGSESYDSRFGLLNDIMIAKNLQDYQTVDKLLEEYYRKDYLVSRLFGETR